MLVYIIIFRIKFRRSLGCSIIVEGVSIDSVGLIVRSTSLGALEVFFIVFLGAFALLLCAIALTKIGNNIGFKELQKIGDSDILAWSIGSIIREYRERVQTGKFLFLIMVSNIQFIVYEMH